MDSMKLLSRLYELLSECKPGDLERAARSVGGDTELSRALQLMAEYRKQSSNGKRKIGASPRIRPARSGAPKKPKTSKSRQSSGINGLRKKISDVILKKDPFSNNREVVDYLRHIGVGIKLDPRDSRKRILSKLLNWIDKLPHEQQKQAALEILAILPQSETSGWFDVMKSPNS